MFKADYKINKCLYDLRDHLTSEYLTYLERYGNKITQNKRNLAKRAVGCFLFNTYESYLKGKSFSYVSLNNNTFSKGAIINGKRTRRKVSIQYFKSLLDFLQFEDYIDVIKGEVKEFTYDNGYFEIVSAESTKVMFNSKIQNLYNNHKHYWVQERLVDVLVMKDSNKKPITFNTTSLQREVKDYINNYNDFSLTQVVTVYGKRYDVQIYKVYNNSSFNQGARSYMKDSIQNLSKQDRCNMKIQGKPVCVYDYKGFEPSLVYTMEQEVMECEDPYQIDMKGYDEKTLRKLAKVGLLIMLNAKSQEEAIQAFNLAIAEDFNPKKLYLEDKIPSEFIHTKIILQKLEQLHHVISHRFYNRFGGEVQYVGSLINDFVLSYMMQHHKVLVVQTHDEFACDVDYHKELYKAMKLAFQHVFGNDKNCKIVREA
uniref:DNA polymerase n=1 Tax=Vibrio phage P018-4 TaxID=3229728 RepID=A0AB39AK02_9CAUD